MPKKLIVLLLVLCLAALVISPAALADGDIYFTAINDSLLPLNTGLMPAYIGGVLYLPYTVFTTNGFDIYYTTFNNGNVVSLYSGEGMLSFDMIEGNSSNDLNDTFDIGAAYYNGTVYVPAYFVCGLFGLSCSVITSGLAPIVRITNGSVAYSNAALANTYRTQMQSVLDELNDPGPEDDPDETHPDVTLFLGFRSTDGEQFDQLLDLLSYNRVGACIFLTADDMINNADSIRRIRGSGHTLGIYLSEGTFAEYDEISSLLYEAAMSATIIITSSDSASDIARKTASEHGLLYYDPDMAFDSDSSYSALTGNLTTASGATQTLLLTCAEDSLSTIERFILHLKDTEYNLQQVNETFTQFFSSD